MIRNNRRASALIASSALAAFVAVPAFAQVEPDIGPAEIPGPNEPGIGGAVEEDIEGGVEEEAVGFGEPQNLVGTVAALDRELGEVTIEDQTFRAHPEDLIGLQPGQMVNVTYRDIGEESWVSDLQPFEEEAGAFDMGL